ncbi:hypothetical protein OIDMADRAFT_183229, partial [Oidiodendron maius Zn]
MSTPNSVAVPESRCGCMHCIQSQHDTQKCMPGAVSWSYEQRNRSIEMDRPCATPGPAQLQLGYSSIIQQTQRQPDARILSRHSNIDAFQRTQNSYSFQPNPTPGSTGVVLYQAETTPEVHLTTDGLLRESLQRLRNLSREIALFVSLNESAVHDGQQTSSSTSMSSGTGITKSTNITPQQASELQFLSWQIQCLMTQITAGCPFPPKYNGMAQH